MSDNPYRQPLPRKKKNPRNVLLWWAAILVGLVAAAELFSVFTMGVHRNGKEAAPYMRDVAEQLKTEPEWKLVSDSETLHTGSLSSSWSGVADAYARSFARLCSGTVEPMLVALTERATPGGRLLDAGTGTGTVAAAAAIRGFAVDGVDSSQDMLSYASRAHPKLTFVAGELPNLPYPDGTFDAGTANFVINHTKDPHASVQELARVLAPGGTAAITIWPASASPMNALWNEVIDQSNARRPDGMRIPPEKDFERTVTGLDQLMTECGFVSIVAGELSWSFDITPEDLWRPVTAGIAVIGATYQAQSRDTRQRMTETFYRLAGERTTGGELQLPSEAIFAVAERPA